ncbi:MAG: AAA-like domain-containing protein, partial [Chloroflexota bacterium]
RYFNTHGPVEISQHYVVSRQWLVDQLSEQIDEGKYFTIFAPRQMGKTTLMRKLDDMLIENPQYIPITLSFEAYETWSVSEFMEAFAELIEYHLTQALEKDKHPKRHEIEKLCEDHVPDSYPKFSRFFRRLHRIAPELKIILVIDEFDATPTEAISPLLQMWRTMYLNPLPPHALHSVILVGIQNIAKLNFGRSSPFNIAYQLRLNGFSFDEVQGMMAEYTEESGQSFEPKALTLLHEQTMGHPFLINRTAVILTKEIVPDPLNSITENDVRMALRKLARETNYNFETVIRHANEHRDDVLNIMLGGSYQFNLNDSLINDLYRQGIIREDAHEECKIANAVYSEVLLAAFRPRRIGHQATILVNGYDFRPHAVNGELQMDKILSRFREFVERRGQEAFKVTDMPQEATGQYLLMAYMDIIVRQFGGDLFTEVDSGDGRIDLLMVYQGHRYVIETKIWRGLAAFDEGLEQLAGYLETGSLGVGGVERGYYVIFHARPNVYGKLAYDEFEFERMQDGKQILVYLVRLAL